MKEEVHWQRNKVAFDPAHPAWREAGSTGELPLGPSPELAKMLNTRTEPAGRMGSGNL